MYGFLYSCLRTCVINVIVCLNCKIWNSRRVHFTLSNFIIYNCCHALCHVWQNVRVTISVTLFWLVSIKHKKRKTNKFSLNSEVGHYHFYSHSFWDSQSLPCVTIKTHVLRILFHIFLLAFYKRFYGRSVSLFWELKYLIIWW